MTTATWRGRRGTVLLGPTEDRVARYLADLTRHGRVRVRTVDLAERLHLERSEAYRITARLRVLGLFGIANDRSGARGGRLWWRTATMHEASGLHPERHRVAWARISAWALTRRRAILAAANDLRRAAGSWAPAPARPADGPPHPSAGRTFAEIVGPGLGAWFHDRRRRVTP
jgi:hypothetical protein